MLMYHKETFIARVTAGEHDRLGPIEVNKKIERELASMPVQDYVIHEPLFIIEDNGSAYYDYEILILRRT